MNEITREEHVDIEAAPVRTGHWQEWYPPKEFIMTGEELLYVCSECTAKYPDTSRYCPFCGALMEGVKE